MNTLRLKNKFTNQIYKCKILKNLVIFLICFLGTHIVWKLLIDADLRGHEITFCGFDCTPFFYWLACKTAYVCYSVCDFIGLHPLLIKDTWIRYYGGESGGSVNVIWGCTGFKQMLMFLIPMLATPGTLRRKLWYIPLGLSIVWLFNIFRISFILYKTGIDFEHFEYWHTLFNNPYYGVIFLLWVFWEELLNSPRLADNRQ